MLNSKQILFCQEYYKNESNGMEAYKKAYGIKDDNKAAASASRLLRNVNVITYLEELKNKTEKKTILTVKERMEILTKIAQGEEKDTIVRFVDGKLTEDKITPSLKEKRGAIDTLNKMDGTYTTKISITGTIGLPLLQKMSNKELLELIEDLNGK